MAAGSASAACTAARRARSAVRSLFIDSILTELTSASQDGTVTSAPGLPRRLAAEFLGSALLAAVSGAHFNPVVSFADAALGGLSWRDAAAYLSAQVTGCVTGRQALPLRT